MLFFEFPAIAVLFFLFKDFFFFFPEYIAVLYRYFF